MTPDLDFFQEGIPDWSEGVIGGGVSVNGVDPHAMRRAHMREQTMAKQAAERRSVRPAFGPTRDRYAQREAEHERADALDEELARIGVEHQAWLQVQGFVEAPLLSRRKSLPPDTVAGSHPADDATGESPMAAALEGSDDPISLIRAGELSVRRPETL